VTSATGRGGLGRRGRRILGQVPAGEEIGAKQNRLLFGFLEAEVLPPAMGRPSWTSTQRRGWTLPPCSAVRRRAGTPQRWHVLTIEAGEITDIQDDTDQLQGCVLSPLCAGDAPEQPQSQATTD
jgi:hypothetical protein